MCNYNKNLVSSYDPTKLAIHSILRPGDVLISKFGQKFKKTFSFDHIGSFIDEENIVTYIDFDCGITFYPETPTKIRQINREPNYISRYCKKPKCIPGNNQITVLLMSSIALISFRNRTISATWFEQLLCQSTTLMIDLLGPISTLNQQLTNLEHTHIRCSLHCERWTAKKGTARQLCILSKKLLTGGRVNETVVTVEDLSDLWKPGAMDGIASFLMNCNCI